MTGYLFKEEIKKDKSVYFGRDGKEVFNEFIRKFLYTSYTYLKLGNFGQDGKHEVPLCVADEIRKMYPSADMTYPDICEKERCI